MPYTDLAAVTIFPRGIASPAGVCNHTVVWLNGEHDISTTAYLSEALTLAINLDEADLVLDLRETTFINAANIGVIMAAKATLAQQSRVLLLRAPDPKIWRLLVLCGLTVLVVSRSAESGVGATAAGTLRTWVQMRPRERNNALDTNNGS